MNKGSRSLNTDCGFRGSYSNSPSRLRSIATLVAISFGIFLGLTTYPQIASAQMTAFLINNGVRISNGATVHSTVGIVADTTSSVVWVNFYVDNHYLASSPPWEYVWNSNSVGNGTHSLKVVAYNSSHSAISSQSFSINVQNGGGGGGSGPSYFSTLPVGATLPSESQCASWVLSHSSKELQPANQTANHTTPTSSELSSFHSDPTFIGDLPTSDFARIDGNFQGTTDQIIRWAACKWGLDENAMRAEAWEETDTPVHAWAQAQVGDWTTAQADCHAGAWNGWNGSGCWKSYGIFQVQPLTWNVWPEVHTSTAFNADFRSGYLRACMNGHIRGLGGSYPGSSATSERFWGCMGEWYSGAWNDGGALYYISLVQKWVKSEPWLAYE